MAGLTEKSLVGTDTGALTLRSAPDFSRALLLTVADGKKLEVLRRYGENAGTSSSVEHSQSANTGGGFLYDSPADAGLNQIGALVPGPYDLDGDVLPVGDDHLTSRNLKPKTGRTFLFAVPATWLSVGDVHRSIVDSALANRIRGGTFAEARSGPQAMESEAYVVTWIREDVARELRLITDTNFPDGVSQAWGAVESASKAFVDADKAYWKKRRASSGLRADLDAAQTVVDRAARVARAANRPVGLARADVDTAATALSRAEADARRDHGIADATVATAQAEVDAFADDTYAEPAHDGWAQLLRDEEDAAAARLTEARRPPGPCGRRPVCGWRRRARRRRRPTRGSTRPCSRRERPAWPWAKPPPSGTPPATPSTSGATNSTRSGTRRSGPRPSTTGSGPRRTSSPAGTGSRPPRRAWPNWTASPNHPP
ncbi:hypothetical protein SHKM778_18800 [Streptomyces sp. KM77-8]|uniref:Uncharacterized protein n=1 Tax=Streptomyces haneummycinicus TaxID=3074435 RepID=A0AAT9HDR7_9ACTN